MREAMNFTFDDIASEDMGVHIASTKSGLFEEIFLPNRSIVEVKIPNNPLPYLQRVELEPLSFDLTFFIQEWQERDNLRQIARWLFQDTYKPLVFDSNPNRIFYAIVEGDSSLYHNGTKQGYITFSVRCNSPYTYSPKQVYENIEVRETFRMAILNEGDLTIKPKMWIKKKVADGGIIITNETSEQIVALNNLKIDEEVYIDFENMEIISSLENVYHFDDHNDVWLELLGGENHLLLIGDFDLKIEFEQAYLAE